MSPGNLVTRYEWWQRSLNDDETARYQVDAPRALQSRHMLAALLHAPCHSSTIMRVLARQNIVFARVSCGGATNVFAGQRIELVVPRIPVVRWKALRRRSPVERG